MKRISELRRRINNFKKMLVKTEFIYRMITYLTAHIAIIELSIVCFDRGEYFYSFIGLVAWLILSVLFIERAIYVSEEKQ